MNRTIGILVRLLFLPFFIIGYLVMSVLFVAGMLLMPLAWVFTGDWWRLLNRLEALRDWVFERCARLARLGQNP